jgi:hypothetical protein
VPTLARRFEIKRLVNASVESPLAEEIDMDGHSTSTPTHLSFGTAPVIMEPPMNFRLDRWSSAAGALDGRAVASEALVALKWQLSIFEAPTPIALDLDGVVRVGGDFVEGFFHALVEEWPESYFGRHPIVIVSADPRVARALRECFRELKIEIPIAERFTR